MDDYILAKKHLTYLKAYKNEFLACSDHYYSLHQCNRLLPAFLIKNLINS